SEEIGQEALLADLETLGLGAAERRRSGPSDAGLRLLGVVYLYAAHLNPVGLFGWLFMARSLGARLGGEVLGAIDRSAGLGGRGIHFLAAQSCADAEHADDLLGLVDVQLKNLSDREHFV